MTGEYDGEEGVPRSAAATPRGRDRPLPARDDRDPGREPARGRRCERVEAEYERWASTRSSSTASATWSRGSATVRLKILMDGHIDCVGVGDPDGLEPRPVRGQARRRQGLGPRRGRRAAGDRLHGLRERGSRASAGLPDGVTVYLTASVMEEDCDGFCLLHLIEREGIRPDVVVLGEPTDLGVYRGHRGRMEATIIDPGRLGPRRPLRARRQRGLQDGADHRSTSRRSTGACRPTSSSARAR